MLVGNDDGQGFRVTAYLGDAKTLLAFDLPPSRTARLAGFTVGFSIGGGPTFYLENQLAFEHPADHHQVTGLPATSSLNAPLHVFRWLHVPATTFDDGATGFGTYVYEVTPRYFDDHRSLLALDPTLSVQVSVESPRSWRVT